MLPAERDLLEPMDLRLWPGKEVAAVLHLGMLPLTKRKNLSRTSACLSSKVLGWWARSRARAVFSSSRYSVVQARSAAQRSPSFAHKLHRAPSL